MMRQHASTWLYMQHKMVVVGHHNFKDRVVIKRQLATQKIDKMGGKLMDENKQGNHRKSFLFVARGCVFFQSYSVQRRMSAKSTIKKLQRVVKEKEAQRFMHRQKEEAKKEVLRKEEKEKMLRKGGSVGVLYIKSLVMKLSSIYSLPSLDCEEGKQYHEKMQFAHSIMQDIYKSKSFEVEFLRRQRRG